MKKLYEFTADIQCNVVVAAETQEEAEAEIKDWKRAWFETGDFMEVSYCELSDIREPATQYPEDLLDDAHVVL